MLSIIIPTLNEEKYLPKLIANIKEQSFNNYEIIISDGNSSDQTRLIAQAAGCKVVNSFDRHPSFQRNNGAKIAQGEVLLFLDADVRLPANFLTVAYQDFNSRKLDFAGFYLKFDSTKIIYKIYNIIYYLLFYPSQYFKPLLVGAAIIVKKSAHEKVNGFDQSIVVGEDFDYAWRLGKKHRFRMIKSTYFYYSPRRWEKEGHLKTIFKLIFLAIYFLFKGPSRKKIVDYDFGQF